MGARDMARGPLSRILIAAALAGGLILTLLWAGTAPATKLLGDQVQLTSNNNESFGVLNAQSAFNSKKRQYLVVYSAETGPDDTDIFAQRLTDLGVPIGGPIRVSDTPGADLSAIFPVVAYSRKTDSYLVAFAAEGQEVDEEVEVFGQRISGGGDLAGSRFRISEIGPDGDPNQGLEGQPAITYNSDDNQYLVAWSGDGLVDEEFEISAQRIAATGNRIGATISVSSPPGAGLDAKAPAAAYNAKSKEFLVVWQDDGFAADGDTDIFGQRLSPGGAPVGTDDFRISETGPDGDTDFISAFPSVAANDVKGKYLVAFHSQLVPSGEAEIKVQRLDSDGRQIGDNDQRITDVGAEGDPDRNALAPTVSFNVPARQFLVTYAADDLATDGKFELFAQRLSGAGKELGANDLRISQLGPEANPDLGAAVQAGPTGIAANTQLSEWLVSYWGDTVSDGAFNAFSRRVGLSGKCGGKTARVGGPGRDVIKLGKGRDVIAGRGGKDNIRGQGGKDRLCGGKGNDSLSGGKGKDRLIGGRGKDRCTGGKGKDRAKGCESRRSL